jgi:5,10-methenyltetrahydrofolate synthetase
MSRMTKDETRIHQKGLRDQLTEAEQKQASQLIREQLFKLDYYQNCKAVFTFVSFRSEVDTKEIINRAILDGKKVYVPKVEERWMEFYEIKSLDELTPKTLGILEPQGDQSLRYQRTSTDNLQADNLMLLPGLAFDVFGNRIGYGAGYYDRYLSTQGETHFYKIALAYDFQVMEQVASDEYDIKADVIISPSRIINCDKQVCVTHR